MPRPRIAAIVAAAALALTITGTLTITVALAGPPPSPWKNLKVLPRTIGKDDLKTLMKAQAKALGVDCDHCHEMPDADKDTKHKIEARMMMTMTNDINKKYLKDSKDKVTCDTCHRGKEKPESVGK